MDEGRANFYYGENGTDSRNMEENEVKFVNSAMEQLNIQDLSPLTNPVSHDEPIPTNSHIVQQKLKEMKELLKNVHDNQMLHKGTAYYHRLNHAGLSMEEVEKIVDALQHFVTDALKYEYGLIQNIEKIETSQFVKLSELPLREAPKLVDFGKVKETFNAEKMNK